MIYLLIHCALDSSMAHRSSSSNASSLRLSSRTVAIAGATATMATAGLLQAMKPSPSYEGSIHLVGLLPDVPSSPQAASEEADALAPTLDNANIAPPDLIQSVQMDVLHDSAMAAAVSAQLKQQGIMVTPSALLTHLYAHTTPQGWLELHYHDVDPQQVQVVLEQVAQWYTSQDSNCDIQACRDVAFIETQIPILQQQQQQLEQDLVALQHKLRQSVSAQMGQTGEGNRLEEYSDHLMTQQHQQIRYIAHVEQKIAETLLQLQTYQEQMKLRTVKVQTGFALLRRLLPQYQQWLTTWQDSDRQRLVLSFRQNREVLQQPLTQGNPEVSDLSATPSATLAQQQQDLQAQMSNAVSEITQRSIVDMPQPVRELILDDVARFEYIGDWLTTVHHLQLLDLRRQTLKQMQQETVAHAQEWQQAMVMQDQVQQELRTTKESLAKYQQRYAIVQQQAARESLAWQVVAPPDVVQEPGGFSWSLSSIIQTTPLMTLRRP